MKNPQHSAIVALFRLPFSATATSFFFSDICPARTLEVVVYDRSTWWGWPTGKIFLHGSSPHVRRTQP
jgi:hypothetical protein